MKTNMEQWNELASRHDLDIPKEGLIFVSGTVKTNDWGLGAFISQGHAFEVHFNANVNFANASLQVKSTNVTYGNTEVRKRPRSDAEELAEGLSTPAIHGDATGRSSLDSVIKKDQTLFLHYYKMKKRWWTSRAIKAAAGPRNDHGHDSSGEGGDSDVADEPHIALVRCVQ